MSTTLKKAIGFGAISLMATFGFSSDIEIIKGRSADKNLNNTLSFSQLVKQTKGQKINEAGSVRLDLTNPDHYQFILNRLAYHGKTPENSPQIFKSLALERDLSYSTLATDKSADDKRLHQFLQTKEAIRVDNNAELGLARVQSSVPDDLKTDAEGNIIIDAEGNAEVLNGVVYGYTDIIVFDQNAKQVGYPSDAEGYLDDANDLVAAAAVDADRVAANYYPDDKFTIESYSYYEKESGGSKSAMKIKEVPASMFMGSENSSSSRGEISIQEPADIDNNGSIRVCLNRDNGDCDIPMMYPTQTNVSQNKYLDVKLPFKGRAEILKRGVTVLPYFENAGVKEYSTVWITTNTGVYASLVNSDAEAGKFISNYFTVIPEQQGTLPETKGKLVDVIEWNIPAENAIFGKAPLFDRFKNVRWQVNIAIQYESGPRTFKTLVIADNEPDASLAWKLKEDLPWMFFEYSCIAKGTLMTMANGKTKPIEEVMVGDTVMSDSIAMRVVDTSIGYEAIPMYRLTDSLGQSVLLTKTHPVITESRGVAWANEVVIGDKLMTRKGESTIISVEAITFNDTVHNLDLEPLGTESESDVDTSVVMYAGGIPVGDLDFQSELSFKDQAETSVELTLKKLPEKWHQDYLNSLAK